MLSSPKPAMRLESEPNSRILDTEPEYAALAGQGDAGAPSLSMFDCISQALLDDFVEAGSDFYWKLRRQTEYLRSLRSYFPVERSLHREREAPRLIPSRPIPTDTIGERCSEPSLRLAHPGVGALSLVDWCLVPSQADEQRNRRGRWPHLPEVAPTRHGSPARSAGALLVAPPLILQPVPVVPAALGLYR